MYIEIIFFFYDYLIIIKLLSCFSPQLEFIDTLESSTSNTGVYVISPGNYRNRDNRKHVDMQFGFIRIELTNPEQYSGLPISP